MTPVKNRLDERLARRAAEGRKALVVYATSGDPKPRASADVFKAALAGGADVVEIGIPFSDPTADGPAIQAASERALKHGAGLATALADSAEVRRADPDAGIVLFGYANPYLASTRASLRLPGDPLAAVPADSMAALVHDAGADGVLCVDLPPEEDDALGPALAKAQVHSIRLVTPVSTGARIKRAAAAGSGFLYLVSVTGVTGAATGDAADLDKLMTRVRRATEMPVVIGFGIANPADAARLAAVADGVVVGSAIVRLVAEHGERAPAHVESFVRSLRKALDGEDA